MSPSKCYHCSNINVLFSNLSFSHELSHHITRRLQAQGALMYDSVFVLVEAFNRILRKKPDQFRAYTMRRQNGQGNFSSGAAGAAMTTAKFLDCNTSKGWVSQWEHGERIAKNLRKVEIEGLTGEIRFNDEGKRINYTLHVVEMTGQLKAKYI